MHHVDVLLGSLRIRRPVSLKQNTRHLSYRIMSQQERRKTILSSKAQTKHWLIDAISVPWIPWEPCLEWAFRVPRGSCMRLLRPRNSCFVRLWRRPWYRGPLATSPPQTSGQSGSCSKQHPKIRTKGYFKFLSFTELSHDDLKQACFHRLLATPTNGWAEFLGLGRKSWSL